MDQRYTIEYDDCDIEAFREFLYGPFFDAKDEFTEESKAEKRARLRLDSLAAQRSLTLRHAIVPPSIGTDPPRRRTPTKRKTATATKNFRAKT